MNEKFEIYQNDLLVKYNKIDWIESIKQNKSIYYKSKKNNKVYCITLFKNNDESRWKVFVMYDNRIFNINKSSLLNGFIKNIIYYKEIQLKNRFRDNDKYCVYCHVNKINQKMYIGISSKSPFRRWGNNGCHYSGQVFGRAIQKYGWDNFEHIILMEGLTQDVAELVEISLIKKYHTTNSKFGYNVSTGGQLHMKMTDEAKAHLSNKYTGRKLTPEWIAKRTLSQTGLKRNDETKMKIRNALSVPIICINDRKIYKSLSEASIICNISLPHISSCCNKKRDFAGTNDFGEKLYWMFYSDYIKQNLENKTNDEIIPKTKYIGRKGITIRNKITNKVYKSIKEASKENNISEDKIKGDLRTKSLTWEYYTINEEGGGVYT